MAAALTKQQLLSLVSLMEKKLCETCPDFDIAEYIQIVTSGDLQEVELADYGLLPDLAEVSCEAVCEPDCDAVHDGGEGTVTSDSALLPAGSGTTLHQATPAAADGAAAGDTVTGGPLQHDNPAVPVPAGLGTSPHRAAPADMEAADGAAVDDSMAGDLLQHNNQVVPVPADLGAAPDQAAPADMEAADDAAVDDIEAGGPLQDDNPAAPLPAASPRRSPRKPKSPRYTSDYWPTRRSAGPGRRRRRPAPGPATPQSSGQGSDNWDNSTCSLHCCACCYIVQNLNR